MFQLINNLVYKSNPRLRKTIRLKRLGKSTEKQITVTYVKASASEILGLIEQVGKKQQ